MIACEKAVLHSHQVPIATVTITLIIQSEYR